MICGACGNENPTGAYRCGACDARLEGVDDAPAERQISGDLVRVHQCLGLAEAEALGRALDLAGIPFFLNNEHMASLFPGAMGGVSALGLGRVSIMVPRPLLDRAMGVIHDTLEDAGGRDGGV